jgi:hypothetical protein
MPVAWLESGVTLAIYESPKRSESARIWAKSRNGKRFTSRMMDYGIARKVVGSGKWGLEPEL